MEPVLKTTEFHFSVYCKLFYFNKKFFDCYKNCINYYKTLHVRDIRDSIYFCVKEDINHGIY